MKQNLILVAVVAFITLALFVMLSTAPNGKAKAASEKSNMVSGTSFGMKNYKNSKALANDIIGAILYMKDPRTKLCFAFVWGDSGFQGGPALATVPCETIPPELLLIGEKR